MVNPNMPDEYKQGHSALWNTMRVLAAGTILVIGFVTTMAVLSISRSPLGATIQNLLSWLFAMNTVQAMWYVTRSAGFAAYLLLWFSTALGLAIPAKLFDRMLPRAATFDFHQFISLLAIGFIVLHVGVLLADRYLPYTLAQVLVPFISPYRPVWIGIGVFSFYLVLLVTITFYIRSQIGMKTFKVIHYFSLLSYIGVVVHSFLSGTDSSVPAAQWLYFSTFMVIVFLTAYWLIIGLLQAIGRSFLALNKAYKPVEKTGQKQIYKAHR
jgi:sulfoxide reductase heme-binding subunit YedZ